MNDELLVSRKIVESKDGLSLFMIIKKEGCSGNITIEYQSKERKWLLVMSSGKKQVGKLEYSAQGALISAQISLATPRPETDYDNLIGNIPNFTAERELTPPDNNDDDVHLKLTLKNGAISTLVARFCKPKRTRSERMPLKARANQVSVKHAEKAIFKADWQIPSEIILSVNNEPTDVQKIMSFPVQLELNGSSPLHERLDRAHFPLELINWVVITGDEIAGTDNYL